jgi:hypothetical protein
MLMPGTYASVSIDIVATQLRGADATGPGSALAGVPIAKNQAVRNPLSRPADSEL